MSLKVSAYMKQKKSGGGIQKWYRRIKATDVHVMVPQQVADQ